MTNNCRLKSLIFLTGKKASYLHELAKEQNKQSSSSLAKGTGHDCMQATDSLA